MVGLLHGDDREEDIGVTSLAVNLLPRDSLVLMKNSPSSTISVPNPTSLLFVMAAILIWYQWGEGAGPISAMAAGLVLAIVAAGIVYVLSRRPLLAVIALVASGAMARLYVQIFGMKARPEHFAVALFCLALPFWPRREWSRPRWMLPDRLLLLYLASNLLSSLVMSIAPAKTLRWAMQQGLVILPYFLLRIFCVNRERFRKAFMILLFVGAAQAAVGVFCFFSNMIFGSEFGMEIGQYGDIPGTYGLDYEANILGALSAAGFVMMLTMYLKERRPILLWGTAITYAAMLIALARAAMIAALVAIAVLVVVCIKLELGNRAGFKRMAATLLVASLIVLPVVVPLYLERFSTLDVTDISADYDTAGRVVAMVSAADGIIAHPILGNGTSSFQLLVSGQDLGFGESDDRGTWIGNTELRVLHDTGIVGLALLLGFLLTLAWRARKILKQGLQPELLALLMACVVYAVTFQATEGTLLEFFWVHMGLLGCAVALYQDALPAPAVSRDGQGLSGGAGA
jgi:O-antigen ligase